ncbi:hypothetical protein CEXT_282581 [Caerostris extrusa]|uniref:Uncharacterized protein n=1 Tax=Caerostris extrusa TaxID=172846 RepID=A0AAV4N5J2_CAEEX|nr:hypothetical protein CEXT_282581 [Caerostris extrusa]
MALLFNFLEHNAKLQKDDFYSPIPCDTAANTSNVSDSTNRLTSIIWFGENGKVVRPRGPRWGVMGVIVFSIHSYRNDRCSRNLGNTVMGIDYPNSPFASQKA